MPPAIIDVTKAEDWRDVVHQAVQALVEGQLVVFPTETVYGIAASALREDAVARMLRVKGRVEGNPLALAVKSSDDALDYIPDMTPLARRLARRCWPGPVTLVLDNAHPDGLTSRLPQRVLQAVVPASTVGFRVPGHQLILDVLELVVGPLVLTSANRSGAPDSITASEVVKQLGDDVDLVLDDRRCQYGQPSSVVYVHGNQWKVLREGVVTADALRRLASYMVLFVCTGNTCRSPMAEALCGKLLADRIGCTIQDLENHGIMVLSAGIAAMSGGRAAAEAVSVMAERRLDIGQHVAQPLTERLVRHADLILTMTRGHQHAIVAQWPEAADRTHVVGRDGGDITDPIGGSGEVYRTCAAQIETSISGWIDLMDWKSGQASVPPPPPPPKTDPRKPSK